MKNQSGMNILPIITDNAGRPHQAGCTCSIDQAAVERGQELVVENV
jgi:hypothetical protein